MPAQRDAVEWLRMMERYSGLTDCRPHFARIADELEQVRTEIAALRSPTPLRQVAEAA